MLQIRGEKRQTEERPNKKKRKRKNKRSVSTTQNRERMGTKPAGTQTGQEGTRCVRGAKLGAECGTARESATPPKIFYIKKNNK